MFEFNDTTGDLRVLLVDRKKVSDGEPKVSLPGDEVLANEMILDAAKRVLKDQVGLEIPLYRFRSFEDPARLNRPPESEDRVISKGYLGFTRNLNLKFGGLAEKGRFVNLNDVPDRMLYDHREIFNSAIRAIRKSAENHLLPLDGMPELFTITQVQHLYETILDEQLDKRNFRRILLAKDYLTDSGKLLKGQNFRPAKLFYFNQLKYQNCLDRELEKLPVVLF
ncbi:MAG: hypothetical protein GC178_00295 [Flavobacteriales bacterium]|nr:hypothetical protein [Flavobacteriales bacterium]